MLMRHVLRQMGIAFAAGAGLLLVVDGRAGSDAKIPSVTFPQAITDDPPRTMPAR
jgi:hypothetical protein